MTLVTRRLWLAAAVAGCSGLPDAPPGAQPLLTPWQRVRGGFLGAPSGPYVRFVKPQALAVNGFDLLVADLAQQRLWRGDAVANTVEAIAGAPVAPQTALALGADGSAWVLDAVAGQVLRFARSGRLLQTWRPGSVLASPVAFALADGGESLVVADGLGAQWAELRSPAGPLQLVQPPGVKGVDAIATARDGFVVLDRLAHAVHRTARDGRVLQTLGRGELVQPLAIGVDRHDRVFVLEAGGAVRLFAEGRPLQTLAVPKAAALAVQGDLLALVDALNAKVVVYRLGSGA